MIVTSNSLLWVSHGLSGPWTRCRNRRGKDGLKMKAMENQQKMTTFRQPQS